MSADHKITWWVYAGDERIRRTRQMRGLWGYDATCSCGWDSRTGGGTRRYVAAKIADHKLDDVRWNTVNAAGARVLSTPNDRPDSEVSA